MGGDVHIPATFSLMLIRMIGGDVKDVRLSPHAGAQYGYRVAHQHLRYFTIRIVDVAENPRPSRAGVDAGRLKTFLYPMQAEAALVRRAGYRIDESGIIGACQQTIFAADADVGIYIDYAILFAFERSPGWSDIHTCRVTAVVT